jgi:hypothetical protein
LLKDIIIKNIADFQNDCLKLCEHHYPTVHNKGMNEHHLARAFVKRFQKLSQSLNLPFVIEPLASNNDNDLPSSYRLTTDQGSIWLIARHLVNASESSRHRVVRSLCSWNDEYSFALQPNDLLVVLSDHWFTKSQSSRELFHWWLGELPDDIEQYSKSGINLAKSNTLFHQTVDQLFSVSPCFTGYGHPLKHAQSQQPVKKYVQLYAIYEWK